MNLDEDLPSGLHEYPVEDIHTTGKTIAETSANIGRVKESINPEVTGQSFGALNAEFAGTAMDHVQQAKEHLGQAQESIDAASQATHTTAQSFTNADETAAEPFNQELNQRSAATTKPENTTPPETTEEPTTSSTTKPPGETEPSSTEPSGPNNPSGPGGPPNNPPGGGGGDGGGLPPSGTKDVPPPRDGDRPQRLEQIDLNGPRVQPKGGPIETIDGMPVKEWTEQRALQRGQEIRDQVRSPANTGRNAISKRSVDVTAVGVDKSTGQVWEGINGSRTSEIPEGERHPLIEQRANSIEQDGPYETYPHQNDPARQYDANGRVLPEIDPATGNPKTQPYIQNDPPLRHAEVKVLNQMLRDHPEIDPNGDPAVVNQQINDLFSVESVRPVDNQPVIAVPFCGNCNVMMEGVQNVAGRNTHAAGHPDNQQIP